MWLWQNLKPRFSFRSQIRLGEHNFIRVYTPTAYACQLTEASGGSLPKSFDSDYFKGITDIHVVIQQVYWHNMLITYNLSLFPGKS